MRGREKTGGGDPFFTNLKEGEGIGVIGIIGAIGIIGIIGVIGVIGVIGIIGRERTADGMDSDYSYNSDIMGTPIYNNV